MTHKINIENIEPYEYKVLIASSSKEMKRLELCTFIREGIVYNIFKVTQYSIKYHNYFLLYAQYNLYIQNLYYNSYTFFEFHPNFYYEEVLRTYKILISLY